jgi:hypothetical protein
VNTDEFDRLDTAAALLRQSRQVLDSSNDGKVRAVVALIDCAHTAAVAASTGDVNVAQDAVSCARAAVITTTSLARWIADANRMGLVGGVSNSRPLADVDLSLNIPQVDDVRI